MRLAALALACLISPAAAQTVPGANDPAFAEPFARAMAGDDPTALAEIHAAAEAGNQAALLSLPAVLQWLRPTTGTLKERSAFNKVNGQLVMEAVAAADPIAALWANGDFSREMEEQLSRAAQLYAAGEDEKATTLFLGWLNQTGGYTDLPEGFFDIPAPRWAVAFLLSARLREGTGYGTPREGETLVYQRLKAGDPAADMALAMLIGLHLPAGADPVDPAQTARAFALYAAAGIQRDAAQARMEAVAPIIRTIYRRDPIDDPAPHAAAAAALAGDPALAPVSALCAAACPETANPCTTAWLMGMGLPTGWFGSAQPYVSLIPAAEFQDSKRGQLVLTRLARQRLGNDPSASPVLTAMRGVDACIADTVLAALPAK